MVILLNAKYNAISTLMRYDDAMKQDGSYFTNILKNNPA